MQMYRNAIQVLQNVFKNFLELLYPRTCCFCGKVNKSGVCDSCAAQLVYIEEPRCKQCGKPVRYAEQEYCYDCRHTMLTYEQGRSIWLHQSPVSDSIYQFKYHNRRIYAEFYAKEWVRLYGKWIRDNQIDLIIPVPLYWSRRLKRGYNQAEVLAKELGRLTGIPVDTKMVVRKHHTMPQKGLDNKDRRKNLQHVFALRNDWGSPKRILVVDDIYTTGNTIEGVAQTLCAKVPNKVWFLTISIGQDF